MRLYPIKRCFRFKRIVTLVAIVILITTTIKMGGFFKYKSDMKYTFSSSKKFVVENAMSTNFLIGSFLKNKSPGNFSHCFFRFGDWESFNYTDEDVSHSPELGDKSPYRVLYGVVEGLMFNATDSDTVTYVTHITLEYLFHIVEIATRWDGVVSVACFLPGTDAVTALKLLEKMCFCLKEMENVNVHFIFHSDHPPKHDVARISNFSNFVDNNESNDTGRKTNNETARNSSISLPFTKYNDNKNFCETCYVPPEMLKNSYRCKYNLVYPVNVARNVARYGSKSRFILVSDIELLPSQSLVPEFLKMIKRLKERNKSLGDHYFTKKRHVYVVPVFEVSEDEPDVPRTKVQLLDLYAKERAVYFHRYVCLHCQRFPGLQRWLQGKVHPRTKPGSIQPLLVVKREFPYHRWEPVFIGNNQEPLYSELLTWEGQQDKMTQMHEMCLLDYRFVILNGAFLVHTPGMKRKRDKLVINSILDSNTKKLIGNKTAKASKSRKEISNVVTQVPVGAFNWRTEHMKRNAYLYQVITQDVMSKYRSNPRCRVH